MKHVLVLLVLAFPALAAEYLSGFRADLRLEPDGRLVVLERIGVHAEGRRIRHGIYRDLKLAPDNPFRRQRLTIAVTAARLDGRPVPYRLQRSLKTLRIYLGDPTRLLPPGDHVYQLGYRVEGAVVPARSGQVLFWNLTGNDWAFPIRRAEGRLDPAHPPVEARAYVGAYGSRAALPLSREGGVWRAVAENLAPGEGLTLWMRFPSGAYPVRSNPDPVGTGAWLLFLGVLAFDLLAWYRAGRDPDGPPPIPRFGPPEGVSAALARRLVRGTRDPRVFVAALLDLAARGALVIQKDGDYRLRPRPAGDGGLPPELKAMERRLFAQGGEVRLAKEHRSRLLAAGRVLDRTLAERLRPYRRENAGPALVAPAAFALFLGWLAFQAGAGDFGTAVFATVFAFALTLVAGRWLGLGILAWERYRLVPGVGPVRELAKALVGFLAFALPAAAGGVLTLLLAGAPAGLAVLGLGLVAAAFVHLLPAYTREGIGLRNHLLGLARYLAVTDEAELRRIGAPADTPAHLERLFPYAVALGLEAPFARRLARALHNASQEAARGVFAWYQGGGFSARDAGSAARASNLLVGDLARGLTAAFQSATVSSSGSGSGGGFSGGGVGGGGGGGW